MSDFNHIDCKRFEAVMAAWFDEDGVSAHEREALTAHMAGCASCRESFALAARLESVLVSRSAQIPAADAFLPALPGRAAAAHPRLVAAFRAMMSPAGIGIILVMWSTMLAYRFREDIARALEGFSVRFFTFSDGVSTSLLGAAGGDVYALVAIYIALALVVLGSTGAITLRYIRHS